jgi:hypothetical protein
MSLRCIPTAYLILRLKPFRIDRSQALALEAYVFALKSHDRPIPPLPLRYEVRQPLTRSETLPDPEAFQESIPNSYAPSPLD